MRYILLVILSIFFIGCASTHTTNLLVKYPIKGEIVEVKGKDTKSDKYFMINYEDLERFIEREKAKTATSGNLEEN